MFRISRSKDITGDISCNKNVIVKLTKSPFSHIAINVGGQLHLDIAISRISPSSLLSSSMDVVK